MVKPLTLTAEQQSQIAAASYALTDRAAFTARVLEQLRTAPELGDGPPD